jgi:PAS domain S-box-containing protein
LCRRWKTDDAFRQIPFVLYTATYTEAKDEAFALSLGADRFLLKPQEPDKLVAVLQEMLEEKYQAKQAVSRPLGEEMEFFRRHNEILFGKLEKKMLDLEIVNQKLRVSEECYRLSFKNVSDVIYTMDRDLNIVSMSPSIEKILGYKPQHFIGRTFSLFKDVLAPESFEQAKADISAILKSETIPVTVYRLIAKDRTEKFGEVSISAIMRGDGIIGIVSVVRDITDRRRAEELYKTLAESSLAAVFIVQDGKFVFINTSAIAYAGYSAEEVIGRNADMIVHFDDKELVKIRSREMLAGKSNQAFEFRMITKQNQVRWISQTVTPIYYQGKRAILGNAMDITENKQAEEALRESHRRLDDIIDFLPDATFVIDRDGKVIAWSRSMELMTGIPKADMVGKGDYEYAVPFYGRPRPLLIDLALLPDEEFERNHYEGVFRQGDTLFAEAYVPGTYGGKGASLWGTASRLRDASGNIVGAIESIRDVTERKRDEEELRAAFEKRQELEFIINHSPAVVWLWKAAEGWPVEYVSGNLALYGYSPDDFTSGRIAFASIVHPDDLVRVGAEVEQYTREGRTEFTQEYRIFTKSGDVRWIDDRTWVRRGSDGSVTHYQGIAIDISDRKEVEKQLKKTLDSLRKAVGTTIQVMVSAVEVRDPYTAGHQIRVADLACAIATEMGLEKEKIEGIRMAGSIHDIGKLSIPAEILSKPSRLNEIEFSLIKEHSQGGYEILKDVESSWPLAEIVYQHHERINGSGYPRNLKEDEILMEARIMAVADVVESMASHRPYRPALGIEVALAEIEKNRGVLYDAAVTDACLRLFREKKYHFE